MTHQEAEEFITSRPNGAIWLTDAEIAVRIEKLREAWGVLKEHGITGRDNAGNFVTGV